MKHHAPLPKLLVLLCSAGVGIIGACANPHTRSADHADAPTTRQTSGPWPATAIAERDIAAVAVVIDDHAKPWKLWLMSSSAEGRVNALEFFSGERVTTVRAELSQDSAGERMAYTFTDRSGRRYVSLRATPSAVDGAQPLAYAGWEDQEGKGHDVVLGGTLFERRAVAAPGDVLKTVNTPVDTRPLFGGQPACEAAAYVARTQAPLRQDSEPGFKPLTKIIADYDAQKDCWATRPIHAVNLEDNTFLIATASRVFRISSKDLSPVGTAPSIRIVDIEEASI